MRGTYGAGTRARVQCVPPPGQAALRSGVYGTQIAGKYASPVRTVRSPGPACQLRPPLGRTCGYAADGHAPRAEAERLRLVGAERPALARGRAGRLAPPTADLQLQRLARQQRPVELMLLHDGERQHLKLPQKARPLRRARGHRWRSGEWSFGCRRFKPTVGCNTQIAVAARKQLYQRSIGRAVAHQRAQQLYICRLHANWKVVCPRHTNVANSAGASRLGVCQERAKLERGENERKKWLFFGKG